MTHWTDGSRLKIKRAEEHIRNLHLGIEAFLGNDPCPYEAFAEGNPDGSVSYRARIRASPPVELGLVAGDAIHNLRSALDIMVFQLVVANGETPDHFTKFPVCREPNELKGNSFSRAVRGLPQQAVGMIEAVKPYKGGNEGLWALHRLDLADKHKVLLLVGVAARQKSMRLSSPMLGERTVQRFLDPATYPLEDGAELCQIVQALGAPKVDVDIQFTFHVALGNSRLLQGEPIVPALHQLTQLVESIVTSFSSIGPK